MGMDDGGNFHDRSFVMKKVGDYILESDNIRGIKFFSPKVDEEIELFQDNYIPANFKAKIFRTCFLQDKLMAQVDTLQKQLATIQKEISQTKKGCQKTTLKFFVYY